MTGFEGGHHSRCFALDHQGRSRGKGIVKRDVKAEIVARLLHEDLRHAPLDVAVAAAQRVPAVLHAADGFRVMGEAEAGLVGGRFGVKARESDVIVEFHEREVPFFGKFAYRRIVSRARIVPVGAEHYSGRFSVFGAVILRFGIILQGLAIGYIALDNIVVCHGVVGGRGYAGVVFPFILEPLLVGNVLVVDVTYYENVGLVELLKCVEGTEVHAASSVVYGLAADCLVDSVGSEIFASYFKPSVFRHGERRACEQECEFFIAGLFGADGGYRGACRGYSENVFSKCIHLHGFVKLTRIG